MKAEIEQIVREVVMNFFKNKRIEKKPNKIFVLLEENTILPTDSVWEIVYLLSQKYSVTICKTLDWEVPTHIKYFDCVIVEKENFELIKKRINESDLLFLPVPSFSTLAKLALTIDDNLILRIVIQAQLDGSRIIVANDSFKPKGTQKVTIPYKVNKRLESYMNTLREDRISIVTLENALNWIDSYFETDTINRPIILAKHIDEFSKEKLTELVVPKNSMITPMAKEQAKNLGISIKKKE